MNKVKQAQDYSTVIDSPIGRIGIIATENTLKKIDLDITATLKQPEEAYSQQIARELSNYFQNSKTKFSIMCGLKGSPFQLRVWQALQKIPEGHILTYGELARKLHSSPRAIGQACRTNPVPIIVPCHRIVASSHLGGFAGATVGAMLNIKKWLLKHEGIMVNKD